MWQIVLLCWNLCERFVTDLLVLQLQLMLVLLLLEWWANSKCVSYLDYYCDCDAYLTHFDNLDVNPAKIVDTHGVTIAEIAAALMFLHIQTSSSEMEFCMFLQCVHRDFQL